MASDASLYQKILNQAGPQARILSLDAVSGGCINTTVCLNTNKGRFFLKVNSIENHDLFEKEVRGLQRLSELSQINTPKILSYGTSANSIYLLLEWVEKEVPNVKFWESFGRLLALQHAQTQEHFGLDHNNYIGRLPQSNSPHDDWVSFFVHERLHPQLSLAETKNLIDVPLRNQFNSLFDKLAALIPLESPALLHGDLWSGNILCGPQTVPYIFDPAIYYGHREAELAFTFLFGGFDMHFYDSYKEVLPLAPGFQERVELHNLYPLLVHANLFGPSYLDGIKQTLKRFA